MDDFLKGNGEIKFDEGDCMLFLESEESECKNDYFEYLQSGYEIQSSMAIDFTGSNGHPTNATSLHHYNKKKPNNLN